MSAQDDANAAAKEFACNAAAQLALLADPSASGLIIDGMPSPPVAPPYSSPPGTKLFYNGPQNCMVACPDGSTTGFTTPPGRFPGANQAQADFAAMSYACQQASLNRFCLTDLVGKCCADSPTAFQIQAFGGSGAVTWSIESGALPNGMHTTIGSRTLTISGTPTIPGTYNFGYTATDAVGHSRTKSFSITVLGITNPFSLPGATNGVPYSTQLTADGGTGPYTFGLYSGALADGLSISSNGLISGTPNVSVAADYPFTARVTDSAGLTCTKALNIHVSLAPPPTCSGAPAGLHWTVGTFINPFPPPTGTASGNVNEGTQVGTASLSLASTPGDSGSSLITFTTQAWDTPKPACVLEITSNWNATMDGSGLFELWITNLSETITYRHRFMSVTGSGSDGLTLPAADFLSGNKVVIHVYAWETDGGNPGTCTVAFDFNVILT